MHQSIALQHAVLKTVLYADIFQYPRTLREIHHFLIEQEADSLAVERALQALCLAGVLIRDGEHIALAGREHLLAVREERNKRSAALWPQAQQWGARIARLPFVRMVAVTGALAVDNVDERVDIDYLIVTAPERLWLCRAFVIGLVHLAARQGVALCPNYFVTTHRLHIQPESLFAAHDLAQMVPLFGTETYADMWRLNPWRRRFLPQAEGPLRQPLALALSPRERAVKGAAERGLAGRAGEAVERWEFRRKRQRFVEAARRLGGVGDPLAFDPDVCKGHFDGHGSRTLHAYYERLHAHGLLGEHEEAYAHRH